MKRRLQKLLQQLGFPRILGLIFALLVCIKLLSACTNQSVVPLSFVVNQREVEYWKPLIQQFNTNNRNIRIDLQKFTNPTQPLPYNSDQLKEIYMSESCNNSPSYDLIYMDIIWVPDLAKNGCLMDLTDNFSTEELKKQFLLSEIDIGYYKKKLYRIPFRTDVGVLYYRKDLLDKVNKKPPETFKDLFTISQEVQQKEGIEYGYLWQGRRTEALAAMFVEVLKGYGGFWIDDEKNVGLDKSEAINAVQFLHDTIYKEKISPTTVTSDDEQETSNKFLRGEAAFMRNWPNVWLDANRPGSAVRGKIAIQPMVHAEGKSRGACKGGWGFGIAKNTKHQKEALEAIKFFTSAATQRQFTLTYGSVPTRRQLFFEPKIVAKYSHYPELLTIMDEDKPMIWVKRPNIPEYAQASCILQKNLHLALSTKNGHPNPKEAMTKAAEETRQLLKGKFKCE